MRIWSTARYVRRMFTKDFLMSRLVAEIAKRMKTKKKDKLENLKGTIPRKEPSKRIYLHTTQCRRGKNNEFVCFSIGRYLDIRCFLLLLIFLFDAPRLSLFSYFLH